MFTMICFGYFETTGGPVLVANEQDAEQWNGIDGDYDELVNACSSDLVHYFAKNGRMYLVFNTEAGNFVILYDLENLILCELVYIAAEGVLPFPRFEDFHVVEENILQFITRSRFLHFFDSTLNGKALSPITAPTHTLLTTIPAPDSARLELPGRVWDVSLVEFKTEHICYRGCSFVGAAR
jgi:hypothetical protein